MRWSCTSRSARPAWSPTICPSGHRVEPEPGAIGQAPFHRVGRVQRGQFVRNQPHFRQVVHVRGHAHGALVGNGGERRRAQARGNQHVAQAVEESRHRRTAHRQPLAGDVVVKVLRVDRRLVVRAQVDRVALGHRFEGVIFEQAKRVVGIGPKGFGQRDVFGNAGDMADEHVVGRAIAKLGLVIQIRVGVLEVDLPLGVAAVGARASAGKAPGLGLVGAAGGNRRPGLAQERG
jgi:hypothetical protein